MVINTDNHHPYDALTPDVLLSAVESLGICCDGRLLALNSYENRVYQVGVEGEKPVVVKFYRPNRWHNDSILEEHVYTQVLADAEIPVIAPTIFAEGQTLFEYEGFRFSIYPCRGGRWPELEDPNSLAWMGRFIARIHAIGAVSAFEHRQDISVQRMGHESAEYVLQSDWIPAYLAESYRAITTQVLDAVADSLARAGNVRLLRIHGDCHPGNVLWTDDGPHFVDLDDCVTGPAVQDLWLFLSGEREERSVQLQDLLEGYVQFHDFDYRELHLVEALRTLRMIHYTAWIARRWDDPAFPRAFPWFAQDKYWEEHVLSLKEQAAALVEPPLEVV